jgi:hypothetical protein
MIALHVAYDRKTDTISAIEGASREEWADVCERFGHDVHRIRDASGREVLEKEDAYTGLYQCIDDANREQFYLVFEDRQLYRHRHKSFYQKLGH